MVILGIKYGLFIQSVIDFIIIAFALFVFVKIANTLMKKEEVEEEAVVEENVVLLTEIRDLLREKNNFLNKRDGLRLFYTFQSTISIFMF